jgi:hypothetical protein
MNRDKFEALLHLPFPQDVGVSDLSNGFRAEQGIRALVPAGPLRLDR